MSGAKKDTVFMPIVIWALMIFFTFKYLLPYFQSLDSSDLWIYGLMIFFTLRIAVCIWNVRLAGQHGLSPNLWAVLGLIFGVNSLLFINIAIWINNSSVEKSI